MYRWELDGPAQQEFAGLKPAVRALLATFMDAVVIVVPVYYQRRPMSGMTPPCRCARCISGRVTRGW